MPAQCPISVAAPRPRPRAWRFSSLRVCPPPKQSTTATLPPRTVRCMDVFCSPKRASTQSPYHHPLSDTSLLASETSRAARDQLSATDAPETPSSTTVTTVPACLRSLLRAPSASRRSTPCARSSGARELRRERRNRRPWMVSGVSRAGSKRGAEVSGRWTMGTAHWTRGCGSRRRCCRM